MRQKKFYYDYEDYEDGEKNASTLIEEIMNDPELQEIEELIIGDWGEAYDSDCNVILDTIADNKEKFNHIKHLFIGDMSYEECEVSWICQGNYEKLLGALKNLEALTIKGSTGLRLGKVNHPKLKSLEIICGGLGMDVIEDIKNASLPNLEKLNLYIGIIDYGFDGDAKSLAEFLEESNFPHLAYLGLNDAEIQDDIVELVLKSKYLPQLKTLDFSNGVLSDKGGQYILDHQDQLKNIEMIDMHYHYMSEGMMKKLNETFPGKVDVDEPTEEDPEDGYPMLTE